MSSRILLINANRCTTPDPVFPLGLSHLNAALRQAGYQTIWLDRLAHADRFAETVSVYRPDYVGISLRNIDDVLIRKQERFFDELAALAATIRRQTPAPIILGGTGFSLFPQRLLELSGADFGIVGEGESALLALIAALNQGDDPGRIPGLVFRRNGNVIVNAAVPAFSEMALDEADRPSDIAAYYIGRSSMLNVQTQRGCRFRCCYCTYPLIEGRHCRRRPAEVIAAEFEQVQRRGARYVFIVDSVFNSSPRHVSEVCEAILRRNLRVSWGCFLRPQGLTEKLMDLMARAGLTHIEFGSDSCSDTVLAAYGKGLTFDDIRRSSELARARRIDYCHFLIAGGPGETEATLDESFQNSRHLDGAIIMAVVGMRIYPGTDLFHRAVAEGRLGRDADLLEPSYYLAPGLSEETVFAKLQEFAGRSPNWIAGDPFPGYATLVQRLRKRGVDGPLWSYLSTVQRLWQAPAPERAPA